MEPSRTFTKLDDVDRAILQLLQRDARHATAVDIAERVGVSDGTVRNRIADLEERGVITGYVPIINYAEAGYQLEIKIRCTSRIVDREQLAREALQITGVISVEEIMTGRNNVEVTAVAPTHEDLTEIAKTLDELGFEVESEELLRHHYFQPCNHIGVEDISDGENGTYEIWAFVLDCVQRKTVRFAQWRSASERSVARLNPSISRCTDSSIVSEGVAGR